MVAQYQLPAINLASADRSPFGQVASKA